MGIKIFPPSQQAVGAFDGGKITEQKPIGFPGEGSAVRRVGPLFYWAWAFAKEEGFIPPHPHHGFEIITYVINGKASHGDSLGTDSIVGVGGAQIMQTGSGVHHQERFIGPDMEAFQIWFEPYLNEAVRREPAYHQYEHEEFPLVTRDGLQLKTVIGQNAPIQLVADIKMWDITFEPGSTYQHPIPAGYTLAALAIRGNGVYRNEADPSIRTAFQHKDFVLLEAEADDEKIVLQANEGQELRMILIEAPRQVDYPLYRV